MKAVLMAKRKSFKTFEKALRLSFVSKSFQYFVSFVSKPRRGGGGGGGIFLQIHRNHNKKMCLL
jgi:hypothetical protein